MICSFFQLVDVKQKDPKNRALVFKRRLFFQGDPLPISVEETKMLYRQLWFQNIMRGNFVPRDQALH